jgi:hypothetical protein
MGFNQADVGTTIGSWDDVAVPSTDRNLQKDSTDVVRLAKLSEASHRKCKEPWFGQGTTTSSYSQRAAGRFSPSARNCCVGPTSLDRVYQDWQRQVAHSLQTDEYTATELNGVFTPLDSPEAVAVRRVLSNL